MKNNIVLLLLAMGILAISNSCTKEEDTITDVDPREAFVGDWSVTDACSRQTYRSAISLDTENSSQVLINNYANLGRSAEAVVAGSSIIIGSQEIGNGFTASGSGRKNGEIISWTDHNFETSGNITECTATYTRVE